MIEEDVQAEKDNENNNIWTIGEFEDVSEGGSNLYANVRMKMQKPALNIEVLNYADFKDEIIKLLSGFHKAYTEEQYHQILLQWRDWC